MKWNWYKCSGLSHSRPFLMFQLVTWLARPWQEQSGSWADTRCVVDLEAASLWAEWGKSEISRGSGGRLTEVFQNWYLAVSSKVGFTEWHLLCLSRRALLREVSLLFLRHVNARPVVSLSCEQVAFSGAAGWPRRCAACWAPGRAPPCSASHW